jgi:hypothetical protein
MRTDEYATAKGLRKASAWANAVLISVALISSLLFIHLLLVYNFYSSPSVPHYYYLIPILGIILSLLALKLPQTVKVKLTLMLVSTVFALYLSELMFYLLTSDPILSQTKRNEELAKRDGIPFDPRSEFEVVEDLRSRGVDAYPTVLAAVQLRDETLLTLSGVSEKTTVMCNESGTYAIYHSDEHGFNNPPGAWSKRPEIVLLGDSFTHGYCVQPPDDLGGQLRQEGMETLTLGTVGNGPLREFAIFKEYVVPLKPSVILWAYYEGNDLDDLNDEKTSPFLLRYYLDDNFSQDLMHRQAEVDGALAGYVADRMRDERLRLGKVPGIAGFYHRIALSELGKGIRLSHIRQTLALPSKVGPPDFALLEGILRKAQNISSLWGGRLYFVYLPAYERYASKVDPDAYCRRREVLSLVKSLNIPVIDLHPAFADTGDPLSLFPFRSHNHYDREGYRLAARTIESYLRRAGELTLLSDER